MADERKRNPPPVLGNITQIKTEVLDHKAKITKIESVSESLEKAVNEKLKEVTSAVKEMQMKLEMVEEAVAMKLKLINTKVDKISIGEKD